MVACCGLLVSGPASPATAAPATKDPAAAAVESSPTAAAPSGGSWTFDSPELTAVVDPEPAPTAAPGTTSPGTAEPGTIELGTTEPSTTTLSPTSPAVAVSTTATATSSTAIRTAAMYPWSVQAMQNTSIGSGANFESSSSTMTRSLLTGTPTINRERWSIKIARAKATDPHVTLTDTGKSPDVVHKIYIPVGLEPTAGTDKHVGIIQPDGVTLYEAYKYNKVDSTHFTSTYVNVNDLRGDGLQRGSRASGISFLTGLIRTHEMADKAIPHTIAIGVPATMMKSGPVWPARLQDRQVGSNVYSGSIPMGSMFAIPPSVDLSKLGLTAEGLALGRALQDYGGHVLVQSGTVSLYTEPDADLAATNRMKADYQRKLFPELRRLTNNTAENVSGGGTRRLGQVAPLG